MVLTHYLVSCHKTIWVNFQIKHQIDRQIPKMKQVHLIAATSYLYANQFKPAGSVSSLFGIISNLVYCLVYSFDFVLIFCVFVILVFSSVACAFMWLCVFLCAPSDFSFSQPVTPIYNWHKLFCFGHKYTSWGFGVTDFDVTVLLHRLNYVMLFLGYYEGK